MNGPLAYGGRRDLEIWKFQIRISRNLEMIRSLVGYGEKEIKKSFEAQWVMEDGGDEG